MTRAATAIYGHCGNLPRQRLAATVALWFSRRSMGDAYTPGLTIAKSTTVRKIRRLPLQGEVVVEVGKLVAATEVVARTSLPGKVHMQNLANGLGVLPEELAPKLTVADNSAVKAKQLIGQNRSFFGLVNNAVRSPIDGTLESVSAVTGVAVFREPPVPVEVKAYVNGTVVEVLGNDGVVVESHGALVQGIFGLGGERNGELIVLAKSPSAQLDAKDFAVDHAGKIVVGGGRLTLAGYKRAIELGVGAVVVGGFAYQDIREVLGYDVGVAVTGGEDLATTLIVTEGFGDIAMAKATFELLKSLRGEEASANGATQIRAGVIRPEVFVPRHKASKAEERGPLGMTVGAPVRGIRAPYFGLIGKITSLPSQLATMPSETKVRVVEVEFDGKKVIVPRANVEVFEK